jgi:beta-xylosidase
VTYRNPVHAEYFADPFVLRTRGAYYAYGTGRAIQGRAFEVLRSTDLVTWTSVGGALEPPAGLGFTDFWAPEVAEADGRWFMYYSGGVGEQGHLVRVAIAEAPEGPFRDQGVVLTPDERFAIDPAPVPRRRRAVVPLLRARRARRRPGRERRWRSTGWSA